MMKLSSKKLTGTLVVGLVLGGLIWLPAPVKMQKTTAMQTKLNLGTVAVGPTTDPATLARLEMQKTILYAQGVNNLSALGKLTISGTVVPYPGFVRAAFVRNVSSLENAVSAPEVGRIAGVTPGIKPPVAASAEAQSDSALTKPSNITTVPTIVRNMRGRDQTSVPSGKSSLPAIKIMGEPLVATAPSSTANKSTATLPINTAYWVASTINLPSNTTIVIQPNVRALVMIANSIVVGSNVTLTYEEVPVMNPPAVPGKPSGVPGKPTTPNPFTQGYSGSQGYGGTQPPQIGTPPDAPQVEVWALAMNQLMSINLKGQHGYKGVQGGGGGDGGPGGNGSNSNPKTAQCKDGPNNGGTGGKGGHGADGGQGGNGGIGGIWSLYAPTIPTSMTVDVSGGERGEGGDPALGGNGGPGGSRGSISGYCANSWFNWSDRHDGASGPQGDPGVKGQDGLAGTMLPNSINQVVINAADFNGN